ncbi:MAG: glycerol-3-phosphate 1-O-acyltransferase PlsY [Gammaproteobacteria bacterium]|nr:glycerol-3-phosphate 1-O-acyltransferase PlsY [Gammaproteobacteria bacterium]
MVYLALIFSYVLGSLSFAIIISKFMKMADPRSYGSKNAGATNIMRSGNKKAAVLTLTGDVLKGLIVVIIARYLFMSLEDGTAIIAICGILVVLGHIYPLFFKFKGGKGVATAIGVILGFNFYLALLLIFTWLIIFKIYKTSSLAAIIANILAPIYAYLLMGNNSYFGATLVIACFILYKHKVNIIRIFKGQEHKFE